MLIPAICQPAENEAQALIQLATTTWQATYPGIISQAQIDYMLALFYNEPLVKQQLSDPSQWIRGIRSETRYEAYIHAYPENDALKVSKLYVLPENQGKGYGRILLQAAEQEAKSVGLTKIRLNVNRYNPAYHFYLKQGFVVEAVVDIPLSEFVLNDYVMMKMIH